MCWRFGAKGGFLHQMQVISFSSADECYVFAPVEDIPRTLEVFGKSESKQERLVIVGGGNIGLAVARALEERGGRVRVKMIEQSRKCAELAADALERTIVLNGDGLDSTLLKEAGIARADAMLAVTDDDKVNMLAAVRAKAEGCPYVISLINDPTLVPLMGPLGIDAHINPRRHHGKFDPAPHPTWQGARCLFNR